MKKKIVSIFVCMLFIASVLASSAIAISINKKSSHKISTTDGNGPLDVRIEVEEKGYRKYDIKVYVKNTWDEKVTITYHAGRHISIIMTGEWNGESYPVWLSHYPDPPVPIVKNFEPYEEKLSYQATFRGISNIPNPITITNQTKIPEGDYVFEAILLPYLYGAKLDFWGDGDKVIIHLPPPKSRPRTLTSPILYEIFEHFPVLAQLLDLR